MSIRRVAVMAGLAASAAWLAGPKLRQARETIRTSSSPGVGVYDVVAGLALGGHYRDIARDCADALAGIEAPRILEIGPGPGHLAERLLALIPDATWTGVDVDPAMLAATERRLGRAGTADRATVVEADVAEMPLTDATFHLVVSSLSAHHWPDAERGFAEIRRVLRPDARALVYDLHAHAAHAEGAHDGLDAANHAFGNVVRRRHRGIGHLTIIWRADLRA